MATFNDTLNSIVREAQRAWLADVEIYDPEIALELAINEKHKTDNLHWLILKADLQGPRVHIAVEGE